MVFTFYFMAISYLNYHLHPNIFMIANSLMFMHCMHVWMYDINVHTIMLLLMFCKKVDFEKLIIFTLLPSSSGYFDKYLIII